MAASFLLLSEASVRLPLFADTVAQPAAPLTELDRVHSSGFVLATILGVGLLAFALYYFGIIGLVVRIASSIVRAGIRWGFAAWESLFANVSWSVFLAIAVGLIILGLLIPFLTIMCGFAVLFMGVTACLAYMYIDIERYEVSRGYKAINNPLKGQGLATHLIRYGDRVGVPLLAAAALAATCGFALFNQGLYHVFGSWYAIGEDLETPGFIDFVTYSLINLYRVVDLLDLAGTQQLMRFRYIRPALWPASLMLTLFKTFFTLVLLQQIFASIRQGYALAESIADFWSPHQPIQERAIHSLPQHGVGVVRPLLSSLRSIPSLTKEQRDQLPIVISSIGPAAIPILLEFVHDANEGVRSVAATSLGLLHALDALPALAALRKDESELVRQAAVGAIGSIGGPGIQVALKRSRISLRPEARSRLRWMFRRRGIQSGSNSVNRVELALTALREALGDSVSTVRLTAAKSLGLIGAPAAVAVPGLLKILDDEDESARCQACESLGLIGDASAIAPLAKELSDPSPAVRIAAANALGTFGPAARDAVPALIPLLQDPDETVRQAVSEAIGKAGPLPEQATAQLVEGLKSEDTVVRAQTAEALGDIGEGAVEAAPALAQALKNGTDHVRAKAAEALGKIGESAADVAVPVLMKALKDKDNWVSALAAEALGSMGGAAEDALPALIKSLKHINPLVRSNTADAIGKMGSAAETALPAMVKAAHDEDGSVRASALRAIGEVIPANATFPEIVFERLQDPEPRVRAAAAETLGKRGTMDRKSAAAVLPLLDDSNDEVKYQAIRAIPKLAGPTPEVVEGLCRRLADDDSVWIRETAAQALGPLGSDAVAAGPALLRAARTGEAEVREPALRAIAMIQPPEAVEAFTEGMRDASAEVRRIASAGWMKRDAIPESAIPVLIEALHDPEIQVRANAAHALSRLPTLPSEAVQPMIECAGDPNDGLRLNAVVALRNAAPETANERLHHLFSDPNSRIRLIAAGAIIARDPNDAEAAEVISKALSDPAYRLRQVAFEAIASLGDGGAIFLDVLRKRAWEEEELELREPIQELLTKLEALTPDEALQSAVG